LIAIDNQLEDIDTSQNKLLEELILESNKLTKINVCGSVKLRCLNISNNQLEKIDLSDNVELQEFYGSSNKFTELNFSCNKNLTHLDVKNNKDLNSLDLSKYEHLQHVVISGCGFQQPPMLHEKVQEGIRNGTVIFKDEGNPYRTK
jgi:hypothetical protein